MRMKARKIKIDIYINKLLVMRDSIKISGNDVKLLVYERIDTSKTIFGRNEDYYFRKYFALTVFRNSGSGS